MTPLEFLVEDQGDGWWHCTTPLRCRVVDGPSAWFHERPEARWPETYWLVRTDPPIEWQGDERFAARWGPDHALCSPIEPTPFALVMASSPWSGLIDPSRATSIPVYPVRGVPDRVQDADVIVDLGVKAGLLAVPGSA